MKSFLELTKERYSVREYLPKEIEAEKLAYVLECVRMAPSACNNQPWRFVVIKDRAVLERLRRRSRERLRREEETGLTWAQQRK